MLLEEFDMDEYIKMERRDSYEDGHEDGLAMGLAEGKRLEQLHVVHNLFQKISLPKTARVPSDAALSAVFCFCAPRKYAIVALIPIANPITTALTRFCNGNTKESAVIASSLMRATK